MIVCSRNGQRIETLREWETFGKPAAADHWSAGRSAYELARHWIEGDAAARVVALLEARPELHQVILSKAIAEQHSYFDDQPRGPRNHDLLVEATAGPAPLVVAVEGKADEPFDAPLWKWRAARQKRHAASGAPMRLDHLTRLFFGTTIDRDTGYPGLACFGYQLLSGLAGTLVEAKRLDASRAVFLVHEFITPKTSDDLHARNARALDDFLFRLAPGAERTDSSSGWITQPIDLRGDGRKMRKHVSLHVAKLRVNLR